MTHPERSRVASAVVRASLGILLLSLGGGCTGRPVSAAGGDARPLGDGAAPADGWPLLPDRGPDGPAPLALAERLVQGGTFIMGSPEDEPCRLTNEKRRQVTLTRPFHVLVTEVTQRAFEQLVGFNPTQLERCPSCPVDSVSWSDAAVFCNRLSEVRGLDKCYRCLAAGGDYAIPYDCRPRWELDGSGKTIYDCPGYRLPTEAEWEHAYRAGTDTALYNGPLHSCQADARANTIAWYEPNTSDGPRPVGQKKANAWGLHDMAGNLWEWVHDWYEAERTRYAVTDPVGPAAGSGKVVRGGSWVSSARSLRAAIRNQNARSQPFTFVGFRCVRTAPPL